MKEKIKETLKKYALFRRAIQGFKILLNLDFADFFFFLGIKLKERDALNATRIDIELVSPRSDCVDLLNFQFFDLRGQNVFIGGAERYILDLAKLISSNFKKRVRIVQNSHLSFVRNYEGFEVIGIKGVASWNDNAGLYKTYLSRFQHSLFTVGSPLDVIAFPVDSKVNRSIGICHGVYWDQGNYAGSFGGISQQLRVATAMRAVERCVSVDTNFINWLRTVDSGLAKKALYVPNYFDPEKFKPIQREFEKNVVRILYPRRLYAPRGINLVLDAFSRLFVEQDNIKLSLVGQVEKEAEAAVSHFLKKFPNQVTLREVALDEMHLEYQDHDIILVPTVNSEGTSLSCIEALASGCAVIATDVGGLPNLVIDGHNGLMIHPDSESLYNSVKVLIQNPRLAASLALKGVETSLSFSKSKWDYRWNTILKDFLE